MAAFEAARKSPVIGHAANGPSTSADPQGMKSAYLQLLHLVERLHRQLLDVIKDELERLGQTDINSVQALLLYNIGDAELTPGELRSRGHYLGSNVSYNLKQLIDKGYIRDQRSNVDRRSKRVSLTPTGIEIRTRLAALFDRQLGSVEQVGGVDINLVETTNKTLQRLERFWADQVRFRL
ncbi:MAG: MarR family transcriptional regulator [Amphiplicatus sp.]